MLPDSQCQQGWVLREPAHVPFGEAEVSLWEVTRMVKWFLLRMNGEVTQQSEDWMQASQRGYCGGQGEKPSAPVPRDRKPPHHPRKGPE